MRLNSLLVSRDSEVQKPVAEVFDGVELRVCEDSINALELIGRSHFDGFIIDCDGIERGSELIVAARGSRSNRKSVIFTIVNKTAVATAMELGSNFVLEKPLDAGRLGTYFQSSLRKMETEHRRYFRYELAIDAEVIRRDGTVISAQILNVSDGGLALRLLDRAHLHGSVTIRFTLPNTKGTIVTAVALICWSRGPVFGIKFFGMHDESSAAYAEWLSSMSLV
ncbi:MAG: response regulator receiver protein [Acidobacteriaceae bacterium]|nr:response regulator receiver protein [Acidobacteriaceae bacterium]